ncbi:hypothetical protein ACS5PN_12980 [Roseateles sp. NT4]|uniref:hypothetical protein n=1 Tax=Roseateles sp. NT4 TaxID=3453715 RepID=UPI003EF0355C
MKNTRLLALAACLLASSAAQAASLTAQLTARSALIGLQIAAKKREAKGVLPAVQNACIQALQPDELYPTTEKVVAESLSADELAAAEQFFNAVSGRKYALHGLLGIYTTLGEQPPEPYPAITAEDGKAIEAFTASPAGQALLKRQVLQAPAAQLAYEARIQELVKRCQAIKPERAD